MASPFNVPHEYRLCSECRAGYIWDELYGECGGPHPGSHFTLDNLLYLEPWGGGDGAVIVPGHYSPSWFVQYLQEKESLNASL